ncbi:MAG: pyridoxal phosphate-dependent aminotransferase [Coxiellaceae bacterium]|nr:pyridoxal phosphate-dependent aminotransferase [Coxiellaceae bacterium]
MDIKLTDRVNQIQPSATLAISARAGELRAEGVDVINMSVGEPDFTTPQHICDAAIDAIHAGHTHYLPVDGLPELKQAVIAKFKNENQLDYEKNQILVSTGAKQSLFNLAQSLIQAGDEVLIPRPYWVSYPAMVILAGGTPVFIDTKQANLHKLTAEELDAAITDKTKLLILNSPSNPSGMCYSKDELKALGDVLLKYPNVIIASDDMYEHLLWGGDGFHNIVNACPELYDRTVVVNGVSKAYAMTGWRIGYAGGPAALIGAMKKVQSHATANACSISQYAALAALSSSQNCVTEMRETFKQRHDMVYKALSTMPGFTTHASDGTFYQFPNVEGAYATVGVNDDVAFCEKLLNDASIAAVPGTAFGSPGHIRLSFATDEATLADAMSRMAKLLNP